MTLFAGLEPPRMSIWSRTRSTSDDYFQSAGTALEVDHRCVGAPDRPAGELDVDASG